MMSTRLTTPSLFEIKVFEIKFTTEIILQIWSFDQILVTSVSTRVVSITTVTMLLAILTHFKLC